MPSATHERTFPSGPLARSDAVSDYGHYSFHVRRCGLVGYRNDRTGAVAGAIQPEDACSAAASSPDQA